jgi:hypothetical protein
MLLDIYILRTHAGYVACHRRVDEIRVVEPTVIGTPDLSSININNLSSLQVIQALLVSTPEQERFVVTNLQGDDAPLTRFTNAKGWHIEKVEDKYIITKPASESPINEA